MEKSGKIGRIGRYVRNGEWQAAHAGDPAGKEVDVVAVWLEGKEAQGFPEDEQVCGAGRG